MQDDEIPYQETSYRYTENPNDYFEFDGHGKMKFPPETAMIVCDMLTERGQYVHWVDGGWWHNPGYEEWFDYGFMKSAERDGLISVKENNDKAKEAIRRDSAICNVWQINSYANDDPKFF
jgi:hypothetical protein